MSKQLEKITAEQCALPPAKYDDLSALFLNCTLSRTPVLSHTEGLIGVAQGVFEANKVKTKVIRPVDYELAAGLGHDMTETDEWERDDWPQIQKEVDACDILVLCTSVWLGEKTSVCNRVLGRMYGYTHSFNDRGQYRDYGKVGGDADHGERGRGEALCDEHIVFAVAYWLHDSASGGRGLDG